MSDKIAPIYTGKYYKLFNGDIDAVRIAEDDELEFIEVEDDNLKTGELYIIENGTTVDYVGNKHHYPVERTPLYASFNVKDLTAQQTRMFWTLVKNCKNGTYHGI